MASTLVKICGNTTPADLDAAVGAGAHALGFLVGLQYDFPSEDELSEAQAADLMERVPPFVTRVLVTHYTGTSEVGRLCAAVPQAQVLQLHSHFPLAEIPALKRELPHLTVVKAVHVADRTALDQAKVAAEYVDAIIADTLTAERIGGSGEVHDWSITREIREGISRPLILAGGLNPGNVQEAIRRVRPHAVDVNTGVSAQRGVKSPELVRAFVRAVHSC